MSVMSLPVSLKPTILSGWSRLGREEGEVGVGPGKGSQRGNLLGKLIEYDVQKGQAALLGYR